MHDAKLPRPSFAFALSEMAWEWGYPVRKLLISRPPTGVTYRIVGNFRGRKLLQISQFCGCLQVFFAKFGGVASLAWQKWAVFSLRYLLLSTWCYVTSCPKASLMFTCWNNQHCRQQKPGNRAKSRKMWFVCCSYRLVGVLSVYETEESPLVHVASCSGLLNGSHSSQLSHIG